MKTTLKSSWQTSGRTTPGLRRRRRRHRPNWSPNERRWVSVNCLTVSYNLQLVLRLEWACLLIVQMFDMELRLKEFEEAKAKEEEKDEAKKKKKKTAASTSSAATTPSMLGYWGVFWGSAGSNAVLVIRITVTSMSPCRISHCSPSTSCLRLRTQNALAQVSCVSPAQAWEVQL